MIASDAIINFLEKENIKTIFGYPGGAVLPLYKSLSKSKINHILVRHEQAAIHAASGYALSSDSVGVCIATSGPGATNLITGIANAYMDSIPVVIITGQVSTDKIGFDTFQEADIIGATEAFTKHSYLIRNKKNLSRIFKEAFHIANTGRKGPVLIDIPTNIQQSEINNKYPESVNLQGYSPTTKGNANQIKKAYKKIISAKKPLLCVGSGVLLSNSKVELAEYVKKTKIPIVTTLKGKGSINEENKYYQGMIGSHGNKHANDLVTDSDLLIIIGMSISTRTKARFDVNKKYIIHIDIDPAEVGKKIDFNIPIIGDAKKILNKLLAFEYPNNISKREIKNIQPISTDYLGYNKFVSSVFSNLSNIISNDAIILADVGNNQICAAHNFKMIGNRKFLTSGGLGTMGFSLPASIGAQASNPNREVYTIIGDGGFQMVMNELITLYENNLNIKIILVDNKSLGMVRDLQKTHYNETFSVDFKDNPNFKKICDANNVDYYNLNNSSDLHTFLNTKKLSLGHLDIRGKNEKIHFSINSK